MSHRRLLSILGFAALIVAAVTAGEGLAQSQPLLQRDWTTSASYLVDPTTIQGVGPNVLNRGVNPDGTIRETPFFSWQIAANPFSEEWDSNDKLSSVRLDTGSLSIGRVDLSIPAKGIPWVVGRTYSSAQQYTDGTHLDSNGYQGQNWFQTSQPELMAVDHTVYIVYGADRFLEFVEVGYLTEPPPPRRDGGITRTFRGVNGTAGAVVLDIDSFDSETYTFYDQHGNQIVFFGFDPSAGAAKGQLQSMTDPAGNTSYVGDYDTEGRIKTAYDASGTRYSYTYAPLDSGTTYAERLTRVVAEKLQVDETWLEVGRVEYTYYVSTDADIVHGSPGDLKLVSVTTPTSDPERPITKKTYFRYWKGGDDLLQGVAHEIKMIVGPEGTRSSDWSGTGSPANMLDDGFLTASDDTLMPYSSEYVEYQYSSGRIQLVEFNGECGCSGGTSGAYTLRYEQDALGEHSDYAWWRTVVTPPVGYDPSAETQPQRGVFITQYFDVTGQSMSRVLTDGDPESPIQTWATFVEREDYASGSGLYGPLVAIHSPSNVASYETYPARFTTSGSTGLVTHFQRVASGDLKGLLSGKLWSEGSTTTQHQEWACTYTSSIEGLPAYYVTRPWVESRTHYTDPDSTTTGTNTTWFGYAFYAGDAVQIPKTITTYLPIVTSLHNGRGGTDPHMDADTLVDYIRPDGTLAFHQAADQILQYQKITDGQVTSSIEDVQTSSSDIASSDAISIWGLSSSSTGDHIKTSFEYDPQGRVSSVQFPGGRHLRYFYSRLADGRGVTLSIPNEESATGRWDGPAGYTVFNSENRPEVEATIAFTGGYTSAAPSTWLVADSADTTGNPLQAIDPSVGSICRLVRIIFSGPTKAGTRVYAVHKYHTIPAASVFESGSDDNYESATFDYDAMGRRKRITYPSGTIVRTEFDPRGLPIARFVGTNDPDGTPGLPPNGAVVQNWSATYDGNGGDGNGDISDFECLPLPVYEALIGDSGAHVYRDARSMALLVSSPEAPHSFYARDNLGRVTAVGLYDDVTDLISGGYLSDTPVSRSAHRLALTEYHYDEQGRVYETVSHQIRQTDGYDQGSVISSVWYDPAGRVVKERGSKLVKYAYDHLGRAIRSFDLASDDDASYADVGTVTGDVVLTERQTAYDAAGNVILAVRIDRNHDDDDARSGMTTGALDTNSDGSLLKLTVSNVTGVPSITAFWYDILNRRTTSASYGTNGGGDFDRGSAAMPSPSAATTTVRVTKNSYGDDGTMLEVQDPMARRTRYGYDAAGRVTSMTENYDNGVPGPGDKDRITTYEYTRGLLTKRTSKGLSSPADDQVTEYTYGTSIETSGSYTNRLATGNLLSTIKYPGSSDVVTLKYHNLQGRVTQVIDQAGNVVSRAYDKALRVTALTAAGASGSTFAGQTQTISYTYDGLGRVATVAEQDAGSLTVGSNEVVTTYDDWGQVKTIAQNQDTSVSGQEYTVGFTHALAASSSTSSPRAVRRTGMTLPDGTVVSYDYAVGSGTSLDPRSVINDHASRVSQIRIGSVPVSKYEYLGSDTCVGIEYPEPAIKRAQYGATFGTYPALDSFGRPILDQWTKSYPGDVIGLGVSYDNNANVVLTTDSNLGGCDVSYTVDGLNRVVDSSEGYWSASPPNMWYVKRREVWTLDQMGNWGTHQIDANGDGNFTGAFDTNETATFDNANEVLTKSSLAHNPAYDAVGNRTDDGAKYNYVYDVFGRLRKVLDRNTPTTVVAEYAYDGLGHMITARHYGGDIERFVYDDQWRIVAIYRSSGSSTALKERYVRHAAGFGGYGGSSYIDDIVLRDRDVTGDSALEERVYYIQNWRHDVSALVDRTGRLVERPKYSAYGIPTVYYAFSADFNGDGDIATDADIEDFFACLSGSCCATCGSADFNGDGDIGNDLDISDFFLALAGGNRPQAGLSLTPKNRFGFAGGYWDSTVGLYLFRNRWYDPSLGTFQSRDPMGFDGGSGNLYEYVGSNPTGYVDPTGLSILWLDPEGRDKAARPPATEPAAPANPAAATPAAPSPGKPPVLPRRVVDIGPEIDIYRPSDTTRAKDLIEGTSQLEPESCGCLIIASHSGPGNMETGSPDIEAVTPGALQDADHNIRDPHWIQDPVRARRVERSRKAIDDALKAVQPGGELIFLCCDLGKDVLGENLLNELHRRRPDITIKAPKQKVAWRYGKLSGHDWFFWLVTPIEWNEKPAEGVQPLFPPTPPLQPTPPLPPRQDRPFYPGACFVDGTLVSTVHGNLAIESIASGMFVDAVCDMDLSDCGIDVVTSTRSAAATRVLWITVGADCIGVTTEHPFYVENQGWTPARELKVFDRLVTRSLGPIVITSIVATEYADPVRVTTLTVESLHTFFVGSQELLVHNKPP
jgi:RHS repeat-associated protein